MYIGQQRSIGCSSQLALTDSDLHALTKLLSLVAKPEGRTADNASSDRRAELAKQLYDQRRRRDQFLPSSLFSEPAWDILLFLYWAQKSQQRMSVSSVSAAADAPATTALRYIDHLCSTGIVDRKRHPTDGRISWLSLTETAERRMDGYFDGLLQSGNC